MVLTTGVNEQPWSKTTMLHRCQYLTIYKAKIQHDGTFAAAVLTATATAIHSAMLPN